MKRFVRFALLPVALLLGGCLTTESSEVRVTLNEDGSGAYTVVWRNLQSDATSPDEQASDFDDLMNAWQSDEYLLEGMDEGRYIKRREVAIEHGVLVGREEGIFAELDDVLDLDFRRGPRGVFRLAMSDSLIRTNGTFVADSSWIEWPVDARVLEFEARVMGFEPHGDFVARFEERTRK